MFYQAYSTTNLTKLATCHSIEPNHMLIKTAVGKKLYCLLPAGDKMATAVNIVFYTKKTAILIITIYRYEVNFMPTKCYTAVTNCI